MYYNIITILGPTATGKTRLASLLSSKYNGEVISADSRQVYKDMNIGTGKDYQDYIVNDKLVKYHLIDIVKPSEEYNVYRFKEDFIKTYNEIHSKNKLPIFCGGTGLYLSSVLQNYILSKVNMDLEEQTPLLGYSNEELKALLLQKKNIQHNVTDLIDRNRTIKALMVANAAGNDYPETSFIKSLNIGINPGREIIKKRITQRLKLRLANGLPEEVESLINNGISKERLLFFGLEYKFLTLYLTGELTYNNMYQRLESAIHHFAKRQMTWFRKMEKEGIKIHWIDSPDLVAADKIIKDIL